MELVGIGAGRAGRPVRGGGVFIGGTRDGGRTIVTRQETDEVHSDAGIVPNSIATARRKSNNFLALRSRKAGQIEAILTASHIEGEPIKASPRPASSSRSQSVLTLAGYVPSSDTERCCR